jgi:site-specific recombinase XerD
MEKKLTNSGPLRVPADKHSICHTLRHTFATYKAEKGVSAYQLQQWLGHANLNTTQIYVHLGKQNARKIMQDTNL